MEASAQAQFDWQDNQASTIPAHGLGRQLQLETINNPTERFHPRGEVCILLPIGIINMAAQK